MTRPVRAVTAALAAVLLANGCVAEAVETGIESDDRAARSQGVLADAVPSDVPGCSAAVGVEGAVAWVGARGLADITTGAEITTDTAFDIASVSKQFTATAVLLLIGERRLALDDALATHVAGLPAWAADVTVKQLIHQTSGIPDYIGLFEDAGFTMTDRTTNADALRALGVTELNFEPGTAFEYSNSNYVLLAEIVERVARQPLSELLSARIFWPLELALVLDPAHPAPGAAVPYTEADGDYTPTVTAWEQVGDGSIQTAPSKLVRWADNYRTGEVGGRELLDAQLGGAVETGEGDRYGAGIYEYADGTLGHDGSWGGFVTDFRISRDRRTSVAVSCNSDTRDPTAIADALARIWG
ncbi:serine hydrolase domain-containing protein [Mycolicibacterium celeriflavum]|uniref:serine hydrolase domain-containing protein n=1 Tax=Mycolicibacterium celeriflavum TaxID=1249101 RepID=UPI003CF19D25